MLPRRWLAEDLNNTEFGLFYMNYHSRLPTISAMTLPRTLPGVCTAPSIW